jgi:hypothetical protein
MYNANRYSIDTNNRTAHTRRALTMDAIFLARDSRAAPLVHATCGLSKSHAAGRRKTRHKTDLTIFNTTRIAFSNVILVYAISRASISMRENPMISRSENIRRPLSGFREGRLLSIVACRTEWPHQAAIFWHQLPIFHIKHLECVGCRVFGCHLSAQRAMSGSRQSRCLTAFDPNPRCAVSRLKS